MKSVTHGVTAQNPLRNTGQGGRNKACSLRVINAIASSCNFRLYSQNVNLSFPFFLHLFLFFVCLFSYFRSFFLFHLRLFASFALFFLSFINSTRQKGRPSPWGSESEWQEGKDWERQRDSGERREGMREWGIMSDGGERERREQEWEREKGEE